MLSEADKWRPDFSAFSLWKRSLDLTIASIGLIVSSPVLLALAIWIRATSGRPVLYRGERVGRHEKLFRIFKFRTMVADADTGPAITTQQDPRVTRVGRLLRATKLDELPQLINVLRGEMSVVGPRPEHPRYVAHYTREQRRILSVRPGITSPATLAFSDEEQALRGEGADDLYRTSILPAKLELDLGYVERQSLGYDLRIIGRTLALMFPRQLVLFRRLARLARIQVPWALIDGPVVAVGFYAALLFRFAETSSNEMHTALTGFLGALPLLVGLYAGMNYVFGLHRRTWRYATAAEVIPILGASSASTALATLADLAIGFGGSRPLPLSVVLVGGFFTFCGFVIVRYRKRLIRGGVRWGIADATPQPQSRALIYGAGEVGQLLAWRLLTQRAGHAYKVVGFIDDDPAKKKMRVHGIKVLGTRAQLVEVIERERVDLLILTMQARGQEIRKILDIVQDAPTQIRIAPSLLESIAGVSGVPLLREVRTEDLVGRPPAIMDRQSCKAVLTNKSVLVTGASGSIGAELCRQIASFGPGTIIALDNNESGLYDLQIELNAKFPALALRIVVADVTDRARMGAIFSQTSPAVIFHVAAYKHVPLMQEFPEEAVRVNIGGTLRTLEQARIHGAERFVLVSTDKAVNPTSVMGATKRIAEMAVTAGSTVSRENGHAAPVCTVVRFGNVLGSRGSVVPTFARQIELGGPVSITHPEMTRYFMDLTEAASLIIQAAGLTSGGDIFMLDMGQRIRIDDLARRMIRMRGLRPDVDIAIEYTGIRPGEKLHEELTYAEEERQPTSHPLIYRVPGQAGVANGRLSCEIDGLFELAGTGRRQEMVDRIFGLVQPTASFQNGQTGSQQALRSEPSVKASR